MQLTLVRRIFTTASTIGELSIDGLFECVTLEDVVRKEKIRGETAIPAGHYVVKLERSPKFGRVMPHLLDVPGFQGILIHWGNSAKDTEGCILVGGAKSKDFIGGSRAAFKTLFDRLKAADKDGDAIAITVVNSSAFNAVNT